MDISLDNLVLITHKEHSLKPVNSFSPYVTGQVKGGEI